MQIEEEFELYTTAQVAEICQVHADTIRVWLNEGKMKGINMEGRWRVSKAQLREFLTERHGPV